MRHFKSSNTPAISPLQTKDTGVQPRKVTMLLSSTYLLLVNLLFICITIHFVNVVVISYQYEISRYFNTIFVLVRNVLTDFLFAFPIAAGTVVPIAQVLQLPSFSYTITALRNALNWTQFKLIWFTDRRWARRLSMLLIWAWTWFWNKSP